MASQVRAVSGRSGEHGGRFLGAALALAVGIGLFGARADASVVHALSIEEMTMDADAIVVGRIIGVGTRLAADGAPSTVATVRVDRWLKGEGAGAKGKIGLPGRSAAIPGSTERSRTIHIVQEGGSMGDTTTVVSGAPVYRTGDHVVAFLEVDPKGRFITYGLSLGLFSVQPVVDGPTRVIRRLDGLSLVHLGARTETVHGEASELELSELYGRIEAALEVLQ